MPELLTERAHGEEGLGLTSCCNSQDYLFRQASTTAFSVKFSKLESDFFPQQQHQLDITGTY